MEATVVKVIGEKDASFEGQDGNTISGKTLTCEVTVDGKAGKMPITAYGKLADKIVSGAKVNVSKRVDKKGQTHFTAKKEENAHLLPDQKKWSGGGGGISEADILFIAACSLCGGDPAGFPQALEEARELRKFSASGESATDTSSSQEETDCPF